MIFFNTYKLIIGIFISLILFSPVNTFAQRLLNHGIAFTKNYSPKEYKAHVQNWAIVQDKRGVLYFGNGDGVIEYDGISWRIIPIPNKSTSRSLAIDSSGRIYCGCVGDLGYLAPDSLGKLSFVSLMNKLNPKDREFLDVWGTTVVGNDVYFRTYNKLFRYRNNEIKVWNSQNYYRSDFVFNNEYYIRRDREGLLKVAGDSIVKANYYELFISNGFYFAAPYTNNKVIMGNNRNRFIIYNPSAKTKEEALINLPTDYDTSSLKTRLYQGYLLHNGNYALTTTGSGGFIMNAMGKAIQEFSSRTGLISESIYATIEDKEHNVWFAMNNGIARANTSSAITFWDKTQGLIGVVETIIKYKGVIYIGTHVGVFYLKNNVIKKIPGIDSQNWSFLIFKEPNDTSKTRLLLGSSRYVYEIVDFKPTPLLTTNSAAFELMQSKKNPNRVYVSMGDGFTSLKLENNKWIQEGKYEGINNDIRGIAEDENGEIWLSAFRAGVFRLTPTKDITKPKVKTYNDSSGLPSLKNVLIYYYKNQIVFGTEFGLYQYDKNTDKFIQAKIIDKQFYNGSRDIFSFIEEKNGNVWISGLNNRTASIGVAYPQQDGSYKWNQAPFKLIPEMMVLAFYVDDEGSAWIGGSEGLFRYNPKMDENILTPFSTLIRNIKIGTDSTLFYGTNYTIIDGKKVASVKQNIPIIPTIKYKYNKILFEFAGISFHNENENTYQYYLEGYENDWLPWSKLPFKEYTNLSEGKYKFHVRAKNIYGVVGEEAEFAFEILAPWYRTIWAILLYIAIFIFAFYISIKIYTKRLKEANIRLEKIVAERTQELRNKNEEVLQQNAEILQQKEEIQAQAEQLELINKELEKLSIVARETDNEVMIMDAKTNFEWVNEAFIRINGYTFEEYIHKFGKNLYEASTNPYIQGVLQSCLDTKKSVNYESITIRKNGEKRWVHTTITPTVDENGNISKLIAIDSDITELKYAEEEIRQRNEEITVQKEALEKQNEEINAQKEALQEKNDKISLQNEVLEFQNHLIKSSIIYAKTIQQAILPPQEEIEKYFQTFIIFKPKDIVSGDFYWFLHMQPDENGIEKNIIAAVDCTGHGVPGAFMSMIGSRLLNEIIIELKITNPCEILEEINKGIRIALRQDQSENNDGMDVCLCLIEKHVNDSEHAKVIFSAAKRPLFYHKKGANEIQIIKGSRKTIGGITQRNVINFTNYEFDISKEDTLYLTTDGMIDQNNSERKRFGTKKFIEILQNNISLSLNQQKELLENELKIYQQDEIQRDDITIVAIRL